MTNHRYFKIMLFTFLLVFTAGISSADIVINEIMQNPSAVYDEDGEWFELYNNTDIPVDLSGWTVQDNDGDSFVIEEALSIQSGAYLIFCTNGDFDTNGGVDVDYVYPYGNFQLSNSSDEVVLIDTNSNEMDRVEYDNGETFPDPAGASMALLDPNLDNNMGENWTESTTPWGAGTDLGTPGAPNFGGGAIITANPPTLDFGLVDMGESETLTTTISNTGDETLEITEITIDNTAFTTNASAPITIPAGESTDIEVTFTPDQSGTYEGNLTITNNSANSPTLIVELMGMSGGSEITPIADIQADPSQYDVVTIEGVVTDGAGVTHGSRLNAFVQDESGKGIMIYNSSIENEHYEIFDRGNLVRVTGTVLDYENNGCATTEITDFTATLISTDHEEPAPQILTTGDANTNYQEWDGTLIESAGAITDLFTVGGGTNITIDDGSGEVVFRVWESTEIDLSSLNVGDEATLRGIGSCYSGSAQYLPAYQDHINPSDNPLPVITDINQDPRYPQANEDVTITATITDDEMIVITEIHYEVNDENYIVTMTPLGNDSFEGIIPGFADGIEITYTIYAEDNEGGSRESNPISYTIGGQEYVEIATLKENIEAYEDQIVTIEGMVTVGAGVTNDNRLNVFVQDESGKGIMLYHSTIETEHEEMFVRNVSVRVTGRVIVYESGDCVTPEITEFEAQTILEQFDITPHPLTTGEAGTTFEYDATLIQANGTIIDIAEAGGGTNITIDDGSGEALFRVWESTQIDLSNLEIGNNITLQGVGSCYAGTPQYLPAYQDHIILENMPPQIESVIYEPQNPQPDEQVTITATITDGDNNLTITELRYIASDNDEVIIDMTDMGNDEFQATIPGFDHGTPVWFYVYAEDGDGQYTQSDEYGYLVSDGTAIPIAMIKQYPQQYQNLQLMIEGIVTVGANIIDSTRLRVYLQDDSGRGLYIYNGEVIYETEFQRRNQVQVIGTIDLYYGRVEMVDLIEVDVIHPNQPLPEPITLNSQEAAEDTLFEYDATRIQVTGEITEMEEAGGGTNIILDGLCAFRVWNNTNIDLTELEIGMTATLIGVGDRYYDNPQYLPAYQDEIIPAADNFTVSGQVLYGLDDTPPVANTDLTLGDFNTMSDENGQFMFTEIPGDNYTLTPAKDNDVNGISAFDAARVAQYSAGMYDLSEYQILAADVTGNGEVGAFDAARIAQYSAGMAHNSLCGTWFFIPEAYTYTPLEQDMFDQDFDALLYGEVTGNWTPQNPSHTKVLEQDETTRHTSLVTAKLNLNTNDTIVLPINITNISETIAFTTTVVYNANQYEFVAVQTTGTLTEDYQIVTNPQPGQVTIVGYGLYAMNGDGVLINLEFQPRQYMTSSEMPDFKLTELVLNEGTPMVSIAKDEVYASETLIPMRHKLVQNIPNPFNPTTQIQYHIPQTEMVMMRVYDVSGNLVKTLINAEHTPGTYTVQWNGTDEKGAAVASGIYFYRLETETFSQTRQMILLK